MSTSRFFDGIAIGGMAAAVIVTILLSLFSAEQTDQSGMVMGYEDKIFDDSLIHRIDIQMETWEEFLETAVEESYHPCTLVIDGEPYGDVGIRIKGNTSLSGVERLLSKRYSFKVEFDQYIDQNTYHGLDKLCLNNLYADNTYMKDYLCYTMMKGMGVASPLCSYVYLTVNGEDWGLYLAAEGVEESFLLRNYGEDYGKLYKPEDQGRGSEDTKLNYVDDRPSSYGNILRNAKVKIDSKDEQRLIQALKKLNEQTDLKETVDIDGVIKYFVVHNFVCNEDGYTGTGAHNYYLYEEDGRLGMIPWDYNLAFGGKKKEEDNRTVAVINFPIDSPVFGEETESRPMAAWIFSNKEYLQLYHNYYTIFIKENFSENSLEKDVLGIAEMIAPYVKKDPTAFCSYEEHETAVRSLRSFLSLREESVIGQLAGSIPSTKASQEDGRELLLQTGELELSLMGEEDPGFGEQH